MKRLFFIRHGLSQANVDDVWSGQIETPLTNEGRQQAILAAKSAKVDGLLPDLIITSPLSRAVDTAKHIANELDYPLKKIEQDELLLERSFGILDGTPNAKSFFDTHTYKDLDTVTGSETVEELQKRAKMALEKIAKTEADTVLIVGHGAFGRALRRVVNGQPYTDEFSGDWEKMYIPNAQIIRLI